MTDENDTEALYEPVNSRQEFLLFLEALIRDHRVNGASWENPTLDRYFDAMRGCTMSMDGYYRNTGQSVDLEKPTWQMFAELLRAARVYE